MTIKIRMYPHLHNMENHASGIAQVIKHYFRYLPDYGIELVDPMATSYDLEAAHAAAHPGADVVHMHGLLWTSEFDLGDNGHGINRDLVRSIKLAKEVTVPSAWVAKPFQRDMHFTPHIIPHGVEWEEWQHDEEPRHILWAKNRTTDGLDPEMIVKLAQRFTDYDFVSTFGPRRPPTNLEIIGNIPSGEMKKYIQQSLVFVASDRETFGIAPLEAMAAGVPVLTVNSGEVPSFIQQGDLIGGLAYNDFKQACAYLEGILEDRHEMSQMASAIAKTYTWQKSVEQVAGVYRLALENEPPSVDIVIPCHNYHDVLERAVRSCMAQSSTGSDTDIVKQIIVVDDSSGPGIKEIVAPLTESDNRISYHRVEFGNVALTRNYGARQGSGKYIAFLDADDMIEPGWTPLLAEELERKPYLGIAYTGMLGVADDYQIDTISRKIRWNNGTVEDAGRGWAEYDYARQLDRSNQIPSGCMVRRKAFERAGGFHPLYCPDGAGSEDAELWLRLGAMGWGASYVADHHNPSRWIHYHGEGHVSGKEGYEEPDWTLYHPETKDKRHPFASIAEPENGIAHPVRSYEKPLVSIVIPVGPDHEYQLLNCLHAIEGQTLREWEAIVVFDSVDNEEVKAFYRTAFPFATYLNTRWGSAGAARNMGVAAAAGTYLTFCDADDRLLPEYLEKHVAHHKETGAVAYSDFVALVNQEVDYGLPPQKIAGGKAYYRDRAPDWRCEEAVKFPEGREIRGTGIRVPFTAAGINILLPREWMIDFDERLETWEDNLLILQLSWAGRKFSRIPEPLWIYDMDSGRRRVQEPQVYAESLEYIQQKYREVETMCQCENTPMEVPLMITDNGRSDLDVIYNGKGGEKWLTGLITQTKYKRVVPGDEVPKVDKRDVHAQHSLYLCAYCRNPFQFNRETVWCNCGGQDKKVPQARPVQPQAQRVSREPQPLIPDTAGIIAERKKAFNADKWAQPKPEPVPEPDAVIRATDAAPALRLSQLNINFKSLKALEEEGLATLQDALDFGEEALLAIPGVGPSTVKQIMGAAQPL